MAIEHMALVWSWTAWTKHNINDQTRFLGLQCYWWMRIVKCMQLLSGIVIFKDIIGEKEVARLYEQTRIALLAMTLKRIRHAEKFQPIALAILAVCALILLIALVTKHLLIGDLLMGVLYLTAFALYGWFVLVAIMARTKAEKIGKNWMTGAAILLIVSFLIDFLTS